VRLLDAFTNTEADQSTNSLTDVYLVMEFFDFDLSNLLMTNDRINENQAKTLIYNLLLTMKFLHTANIMHRDLKPSNILITEQCTIKLCDFGFARTIREPNGVNMKESPMRPLSPICFTRYYRPPELIFQNKVYDEKADVWSTGCVISEIIQQLVCEENKNKILFKGSSCYPISPTTGQNDENVKQIDSNDQLLMILGVLS
jgi:serine/threonine protein kinase